LLRSEIISKDYEVGEINPLIYNETVNDFNNVLQYYFCLQGINLRLDVLEELLIKSEDDDW